MKNTVAPVLRYDAIDAEWLTHVLRRAEVLTAGRVVDVGHGPCGTGQLADSYRFTVTYDPPGAGPATVVGKFASDDPASRGFGQQSGYYRNEIRFYAELAASLSVVVPTSFHAAIDADQTEFVLLMEDLAPARVQDQLIGCSADDAALVVEQLAALHADSWRRPELAELAWLQGTSASFSHVTDNFAATVEAFPGMFGNLVPDEDLAEARRLLPHVDAWKRAFTRPQCLWHSDLRADNLLFEARDGELPVALLDWQGVGYARGTIDLSYFLGTSLTVEDRRVHERGLVQHYHDVLTGHGVAGFSADQCWDDYRMLAIHTLQVGVFGAGAVKRSARGDQMWKSWIDRAAAQTRDLESFALLSKEGDE
jgi:aminoglycoside phosphotransferase (APT) family kinase protein